MLTDPRLTPRAKCFRRFATDKMSRNNCVQHYARMGVPDCVSHEGEIMDPIQDDELKLSRRMKQYQQYQEHLDQIDKTDKKDISEPSGEMQGKKIKKNAYDNSQAGNVFTNSIKKIS
jgi:hypothetical protein